MTTTPSAPEPTVIEVAGFWVTAVGTLASTVIAIVAVVLSIQVARSQHRRDARAGRAEWAHQFSVWLGAGSVYMAAGIDAAVITDPEWVERGNDIQSRGRLLESGGANNYMRAARDAWEHIETLPVQKRVTAALNATRMLKFWVEGWVNDPDKTPGEIVPWLDTPGEE